MISKKRAQKDGKRGSRVNAVFFPILPYSLLVFFSLISNHAEDFRNEYRLLVIWSQRSRPRAQFFPIWTSRPANNIIFIYNFYIFRYYHMCSIWGGFLSLASILDFQRCTDEAQKAETALSAVS